MGRVSFENFGRIAAAASDPSQVTLRYAVQRRAERLILRDVMSKLEPGPDDDLLEIGCGPGTTLVPLAFVCASTTAVDHPDVLRLLRQRFAGPPEIELIAGNFLDVEIERTFSRILIYSVLHYLTDVDEAIIFALKAARLLRPGGRMLIGDVPNRDRKARFLESPAGQEFEREWKRSVTAGTSARDHVWQMDEESVGAFDDEGLTRLMVSLRAEGFDTELLGQSGDLPFGHSREDIVVLASS